MSGNLFQAVMRAIYLFPENGNLRTKAPMGGNTEYEPDYTWQNEVSD